jgi:hypothetical protein
MWIKITKLAGKETSFARLHATTINIVMKISRSFFSEQKKNWKTKKKNSCEKEITKISFRSKI